MNSLNYKFSELNWMHIDEKVPGKIGPSMGFVIGFVLAM